MSKEVAALTDKQQGFLDALQSPEIVSIPSRQRFRWAATRAGFSETTAIEHITKPILKQITEVAEKLIMQASISAAWVLTDTVDGENIESMKTKFQLDAAKEILDRAVPKKEPKAVNQGPLVQIMLPAKDVKIVEVVDD